MVAPAKSDALSPERHASTSRLAGAAGLGYVAAVSIENMEILEAPTLDSSVGEINAFFGAQALGVVTTAAGAVFACPSWRDRQPARPERGHAVAQEKERHQNARPDACSVGRPVAWPSSSPSLRSLR